MKSLVFSRMPSLVAGLVLFVVAQFPAVAASAVQSHDVTVNGVNIHYLEAGKGPTVVLLHGFAETSHMWLPLIAELQKNHRVIAPDLRGSGDSGKPDGGYDKKTMARDIHALVEKLGGGPIEIVGHDIGLMVAYAYAAQYPADVQRIVLMDAFLPGVGDWTHVWLLRDLWHFHFYGETPQKLVTGRERVYLDHFWNDFAADRNHSVSEADRQIYTHAFAQPGAIHGGFGYFSNFEQDAKDFAGFSRTKLTMPMLVLSGEKAGGQFLIDQAKMVDSNVTGVIVKGSGHWLMEEAPGQVIPQLVAFLNAAPANVAAAH